MLYFNIKDLNISSKSVCDCIEDGLISEVILVNDNPNHFYKIINNQLYVDGNIMINYPNSAIIKCFNNPINLGIMFSRIEYLNEITNKYFFYFDSDDIILIEGIKHYYEVSQSNLSIGLVSGLNIELKDTAGELQDFIKYPNKYKQIQNLYKWREDCLVGCLLNTEYWKLSMELFKDNIVPDLIEGYGSNIINCHEDRFLSVFYRSWMYTNHIPKLVSTIPIMIFNYCFSIRKDKLYIPEKFKDEYWDNDKEENEIMIKLINTLTSNYFKFKL